MKRLQVHKIKLLYLIMHYTGQLSIFINLLDVDMLSLILFKPVNIEKSVFMLYINIIFCK